jgi:protein SCO1
VDITKLMFAVVLTMGQLAAAGDRPGNVPDPRTDFDAYQAYQLRDHFPNVVLVTQNNKKVHFYDDVIKGKIVLIQFMLANCEQLCPRITPNLVKVQKELQKRGASEVALVSLTVDPTHDTPEVLKKYADKFHVQPGWKFLTGRKSDIDLIRRKLGVYDPDDKKFEHMNMLTIGREPNGRWFAIPGEAKPDEIVQTVLRLTDTNHKTGDTGRKPASASHARLMAGK